MKKSFTLGAVSGITALAVGFPIAAQFAGAQGASSPGRPKDVFRFEKRLPLSQDDVQELVDRDNAILLHIDAFVSIYKEAVQNHRIALQAAADIADEAERNDAVRAAHEAMHAEIKAAIEANPDLQGMMPFGLMKAAHGPGKHMMKVHFRGELGEKLGMSEEELQAAIESGRTIREIAEEKGVELPEPPDEMRRR